jgi:prepilin-type N-terminal cleavage/methylation domain-containing protein
MSKREKNFFSSRALSGFTLLEVIIAIFIFTVGLVAVWSLIQQPLSYSKIASQKLIAIYLAQEGIEIVRNIRDSNLLKKCYFASSTSWDTNELKSGNYQADYESEYLVPYELPPYKPSEFLKIEDGFYKYSSTGTETKFKRKINISEIIEEKEGEEVKVGIKVRVDIFYGDDKGDPLFSVQEELYDLYEALKDKARNCL